MTTTFKAKFDGKVLLPEEPHNLHSGQEYLLQAEPTEEVATPTDAWSVIRSLVGSVHGPVDLAENHDHYLYGLPKKDSDR